MTAADIRSRMEAATPGPWEVRTDDLTDDVDVVHDQEQVLFVATCGNKAQPRIYDDAEFIAHAPTDIARLLAAVDAVEALADYWEQTPALRRGPAATELRTALATALEGKQ